MPCVKEMSNSSVSSRQVEGQPLMLAEEGRGSMQPAPTKPGEQVRVGLTRELNAVEEKQSKDIDRAEMQRALESMPLADISEADLHTVPWEELGKEFARNFSPAVVLIGLVYWIARATPPFPFGMKMYILPIPIVLLFGLSVFLVEMIVVWVRDAGPPHGNRLRAVTPLLQAMTGRRVLKLETKSDVYIFAHSLERRPNTPGAFVELVVNPVNVEAPRKIFRVGDQEVIPSRWKATGLQASNRDYSEDLLQAASGDLYPSLAQVVERWLFEDVEFQLPCQVVLMPASSGWRLRTLWGHWAVRVIFNAVMMSFSVNPTWAFLNTMKTLRIQYCFQDETSVLPVCGPDQDGRTCEEFCRSLVSFIGGVGTRIRVEEIEFIWTFCLASVMVFVVSLVYVRNRHQLAEMKFVLSMGGVTKAAKDEVIQVRRLLEDNLTLYGTLQGLCRQWKAYHMKLRACECLTTDIFSGPAKIQNPCFWEVTQHVRDVRTAQATPYPISMPISALEHDKADVHGESRELPTWQEKIDSAKRELVALKNLHGFSRKRSVPQKEFKFCVIVPVTCRESLELLKTEFFAKTGPRGYSAQLDAIFSGKDCQDQPPSASDETASFCHVTEDFRVGPLLIPAGVCLTHIACQTPSMEMLSLEVGSGKDISSREEFLLLFHGKDNPNLNSSLVLERFSEKHHWPSIMLSSSVWWPGVDQPSDMESPSPVDSQGLAVKMKDAYIYQFHLVFQLSPMYFRVLQQTAKDADMSLYGFTEGILTRLVDAPVPEPQYAGPMVSHAKAIYTQSWQDSMSSQLCLITEVDKVATSSKFFSLLSSLAYSLGLVFACGCFTAIVPLFRYFRWGGEVFPVPVAECLILNAIFQFVCLVGYFWLFTAVSSRLDAVAQALSQFESRTLAPAVAPAKAKQGSGKASSSGTPPAPLAAQENPFLLYLGEIREYKPDDPVWVSKWQQKEAGVMSWHLCARYLRIFVSGARLTAQAILVAAAAILLVMLLVDLWQGLRGYGALDVNNAALLAKIHDELSSNIASTVSSKITDIAKQASDAAKMIAEKQAAEAAHSALHRRLLNNDAAGAWGLDVAAQALANALAPLDSAVKRVHQRQLLDLGKQMHRVEKFVTVGNVQQITQAQLLSICMTLLLLFFSCYLLVRIARINDYVEKHESILVQVKEQHMQNQSERERRASEEAASCGVKLDGSAKQAVAAAQASYERMLGVSIEGAHDNRSRFPIKLFSFVITQGLLLAWLATAMQPLVQQTVKVGPVLLGDFCRWIGSQDLVEEVQSGILNASAGVETAIFNDTKVEPSDGNSLFYSIVCTPLVGVANELGITIDADIEKAKNASSYERRLAAEEREAGEDEWLLSKQAVVGLVEEWWESTPGDPQAKLALAQLLLRERARSARSLLAAGPAALQHALRSGALATGPSQMLGGGLAWPAVRTSGEL